MTLLNNAIFDDGSFECYNFWLAGQDGVQQVDASSDIIQHMREFIEPRMAAGHSHLRCTDLVYGGEQILEIQWG